jgi:uncharacterized protein
MHMTTPLFDHAPATLPRMSMVTLGVSDLARAKAFYTRVFGRAPVGDYEGVAFYNLPGVWISLYPRQDLARDISPALDPVLDPARRTFSGITLAHNARSREDVLAIFSDAQAAGATVVTPPHDTFWGGFSGYFADPDGHYWEVAWGPMFGFSDSGDLQFKEQAS